MAIIALAGCGSSGQSSVEQDTAMASGDASIFAEIGPTLQTAPTLETAVDRAALAAAVMPQVSQLVSASADTIQLGRPWGQFDVHTGPRLVFRGSWRLLAAISGDYFAVVDVVREGNSYKMAGIGSAVFVPTMVAREQIPAVSSALDLGRAGFLRRIGEGGDSLLAYEAETVADAGQGEIRVQPLGEDRRFQGVDASVGGVAEMSLDELNPMLSGE